MAQDLLVSILKPTLLEKMKVNQLKPDTNQFRSGIHQDKGSIFKKSDKSRKIDGNCLEPAKSGIEARQKDRLSIADGTGHETDQTAGMKRFRVQGSGFRVNDKCL